MSCLFEPIHGRFPTNSICDSYPDCVGCSYSDSFKQPKKTNADSIRTMTDEELADWISNQGVDCAYCRIESLCYEECKCADCDKAWLKWLKQEAET